MKNSVIKKILITFHSVLLAALVMLTFFDLKEMLVATFLPIIMLVLILIFLNSDSKLVLIPAILLVAIFTFAFATMVIGNIVWSEVTLFLTILLYTVFLIIEIITIVYGIKVINNRM